MNAKVVTASMMIGGHDLLQDPAVAVRIAEPRERGAVAASRIPAGELVLGRLVKEDAAEVVEGVAHLDTAGAEGGDGDVDVGDREMEPLRGARNGGGHAPPEDDRGARPPRGQAD